MTAPRFCGLKYRDEDGSHRRLKRALEPVARRSRQPARDASRRGPREAAAVDRLASSRRMPEPDTGDRNSHGAPLSLTRVLVGTLALLFALRLYRQLQVPLPGTAG